MTLRLSGHIINEVWLSLCSSLLCVLRDNGAVKNLAILSLKPLLYRTWTIVLLDLLIYFTIKLESLTNASDASTELILQFPCKLEKKPLRCIVHENLRIPTTFFSRIKTHSDQINYLTCKAMLIEYNVLKCNLIL